MSIPIKKELNYPAFAVWGTKRGKKVFFFDQFEQQETVNSIDGILTDLRDAVSNPSTTTPFYSLEKKGNVCIFSIYTSINDWLGRSGYYAVSFLMHANQEFRGSSILEALKHFSSIYYDNAIKNPSQQNRISEYTDEEANKVFFQKEFKKELKYQLQPALDTTFHKGTEKACFNYTDETEIDTFFKNRNHTDIVKYQTIYFLPKDEETQTALTCINEIPAFKPVEKVEEIILPKEETKSKIELPPKDDTKEDKDIKKQDEKDDFPEVNTKGEKKNNEQDSQPKEDQTKESNKVEDKKQPFFKSKNGKIIIAVLIPIFLFGIGGMVYYIFFNEEDKEIITENREGFSDEQLETFMGEINVISSTIVEPNWSWNKDVYMKAYYQFLQKDTVLIDIDKQTIDDKSKKNLNKAKLHRTNKKGELNAVIFKKANKVIDSTGFDFLIARELEVVIDSFKISYEHIEKLRKYKAVAFRDFQARKIIKDGVLPKDKNAVEDEKNNLITDDFEKASQQIIIRMEAILKTKDYEFLTDEQKCHLIQWIKILKARTHKKDTQQIIDWVVGEEKKGRNRAKEIRNFIDNGECIN